jgi:formylglycine-generating enzyme required for sulfatase activity
MREWAQAQPLHEVELPSYFIARHEVTFAEWIEFLRALPADERRRRTPEVANGEGAVSLEELPGGWQLTLQAAPGARTLRAMSGAPIVYPDRHRRAKQDWLKFPVTGISWNDIVAYTAWLDRTQKVPGARPCSEREWERAGRGADDRRYPHGDVLEPDDANFDLSYGQQTDAFGPDEVGSHPASDSPFGVADLSGNALEPAQSLQRDQVVLCSAAFYRDRNSNWLVTRMSSDPKLRTVQLGARICADAPHGEPSRE